MSSTTRARLNRLEKQLGDAATSRRAYSHSQLVRMATYLHGHQDQPPATWDEVVGPPAQVLPEGKESCAEIIERTVRESAARLERMAAGKPGEVV